MAGKRAVVGAVPSGRRGTPVRMAVLAVLWGSGFLWIKLALDGGLAPLEISVVRCLLGGGVLLALARSAGQRLPRDRGTWGHLVVAAFFCNVVPFLLFGVGEQSEDFGVFNASDFVSALLKSGPDGVAA